MARTLAQTHGPEMEAACSPHQYALSTHVGTDCVGLLLRAAADSDPDRVILSLDGIGAFDHIKRAAMLGKVDILKAFLKDNGDLAQQKGAHGIPLIVHAVADGQDEVVEFLKSHAPSKNSGVALMNCELEGLIRTKNC